MNACVGEMEVISLAHRFLNGFKWGLFYEYAQKIISRFGLYSCAGQYFFVCAASS